jgi:tetratricopeptide (TPR) repeat protein
MSEMLANQYFMARKYDDAVPLFERLVSKNPQNLRVKKKLVICYTQTGQIERAVALVLELLRRSPRVILDTDIDSEDCPCPELTERMERRLQGTQPTVTDLNQLGILYLYCDLEASLQYFQGSLGKEPNQPQVREILAILTKTSGEPAGANM